MLALSISLQKPGDDVGQVWAQFQRQRLSTWPKSFNNLGILYPDQGKMDEAEEMHLQYC